MIFIFVLKKLETLFISGNKLKNIDIINCSELIYLDLSDNLIEDIDFSGCLNLKDLYLKNNKISFDCLFVLKKLESLDIRGISAAEELNVLITNLPHLKTLIADPAQLGISRSINIKFKNTDIDYTRFH